MPETKSYRKLARDEDVKVEMLLGLERLAVRFLTEVPLPAHAKTARTSTFPADIVAYYDLGDPAIAIEAKAYKDTLGYRQHNNYALCGLPAMLVTANTVDVALDAIAALAHRRVAIPGAMLICPCKDWKRATRTWLSVYGEAWESALGGRPPWGQLARFVKPLRDAYGEDEVLRRFKIYLADAGKYASPTRFAQTFGLWKQSPPQSRGNPLDPRPGESADDYIARVAR